MFSRISQTLFVMMLSMLSSLIATILIGRHLAPVHFGEFALLKNFIVIGPTLAIMGADQSYIKLYSRSNPKNIHWTTSLVAIMVSILFSIILKLIYGIPVEKILYINVCVFMGALSLYLAAYYRVQNRFFFAQLIQGGWRILFLILVVLSFFILQKRDIHHIYILLTTVFVIMAIPFFLILAREFKTSAILGALDKTELKRFVSYGFVFWLINGLGLLFGGLDKFLIPLIFNNEILGIYVAISFIFTISFSMLGSAVGYVIFPTISKGSEINWKLIISFLSFMILCAFIVFISYGKAIVSLIFNGIYDVYSSDFLVVCFTILGVMQLIHTILHFVIVARGTKFHYMKYIFYTLFISTLFILSVFLFSKLPSYNLNHIAINVLIIWLLKIIASFLIVLKLPKRKFIT